MRHRYRRYVSRLCARSRMAFRRRLRRRQYLSAPHPPDVPLVKRSSRFEKIEERTVFEIKKEPPCRGKMHKAILPRQDGKINQGGADRQSAYVWSTLTSMILCPLTTVNTNAVANGIISVLPQTSPRSRGSVHKNPSVADPTRAISRQISEAMKPQIRCLKAPSVTATTQNPTAAHSRCCPHGASTLRYEWAMGTPIKLRKTTRAMLETRR